MQPQQPQQPQLPPSWKPFVPTSPNQQGGYRIKDGKRNKPWLCKWYKLKGTNIIIAIGEYSGALFGVGLLVDSGEINFPRHQELCNLLRVTDHDEKKNCLTAYFANCNELCNGKLEQDLIEKSWFALLYRNI